MKGVYDCLLTNERLAAHCSVTLSLRCGCCRIWRAQLSYCSQWTVSVQYSCTVRGLTPNKEILTLVACLATRRLQPGFKGWGDLFWASGPSLAPVASDNNINQSPSHLSLSQRKYILPRRYAGLYFQRYFSLLIFCLNIRVRKAHEKWGHRI